MLSVVARSLPVSLGPVLVGLGLVAVSVARIHVRVETTLVGYEIGHLKGEEQKLLEERSALKMQLAKLTTQKHLMLMTDDERPTASEGTYALK